MSSYSSIAHAKLEICSPVRWQVYKDLLLAGGISAHPEILDIGCGKAGILAKATELLGGRGTGVDIRGGLADEPTQLAQKLEAQGQIEFVFEDARIYLENLNHSFDLIICIGSSHAAGGSEQLFETAFRKLKRGGKLLFGELVWQTKPDQALLNFLKCEEADQMYAPQLFAVAEKAGLIVQQAMACTPEDFEAYELALRKSIIDWCKENARDPRSSEFASRSEAWWKAREKWARQAFGFEVMLAAPV